MADKQDYSKRFNLNRSIGIGKRRYFDMVRKGIESGEVVQAEDDVILRQQAIEQFSLKLDEKIASMKPGQYLAINFTISVVNSDGSGVTEPSSRTSPEAHAWRKSVFQRDNYTCVECGHNGRLQAHHIIPWADSVESRFDINNGVTLCVECHKAKHPKLANLIGRSRYHEVAD